ncbi:MAG: hypothetical protein K0R06_1568 [Clostridium sp.]|jgi:hypothetical protein|nr:hypothetical protein [Clostridium sp.]
MYKEISPHLGQIATLGTSILLAKTPVPLAILIPYPAPSTFPYY